MMRNKVKSNYKETPRLDSVEGEAHVKATPFVRREVVQRIIKRTNLPASVVIEGVRAFAEATQE